MKVGDLIKPKDDTIKGEIKLITKIVKKPEWGNAECAYYLGMGRSTEEYTYLTSLYTMYEVISESR